MHADQHVRLTVSLAGTEMWWGQELKGTLRDTPRKEGPFEGESSLRLSNSLILRAPLPMDGKCPGCCLATLSQALASVSLTHFLFLLARKGPCPACGQRRNAPIRYLRCRTEGSPE